MRGYDDRRGYRWKYGWDDPAFSGWYPGAFWASAPAYGWGWWGGAWGWPPYPAPLGYGARAGYDRAFRRRRPEESPTYGRGGDRAARRWAERYGYDVEMTIRPRPGTPPRREGYDRGFRRR